MTDERGGIRLWHLLIASAVIGAAVALLSPATCPYCRKAGDESTTSPPVNEPGRADADAKPIQVKVVDRAGFDAVIAKHRGQLVLVDYWATWCLPCVEQLPHTLDLARRYAGRGLAVVTVSCDEPQDAARVEEFLRGKQAGGATHLISQFGGSPQTMEEFDITSGAVPYYQLYDRAGRLRHTFGINPVAKKKFTPPEIDAAIEQLLSE